jgi:hypothetical protein
MKTKLTLLAIGSSLLLIGCYVERPHGYARGPAVEASYTYVYYPDVEVYFEPHRHVYYWPEGGAWRSGPRVPQNIVLRSHVTVDLDSPEPYRHHDEVRAKYPRQRHEEEHERKHQDRDQQ